MKRIKLKDRKLPTYSKGEEIFNMVTHIVGGGLGVIALISCIIVAAIHNNSMGIISGIIYGLSLIEMYTISSIYHGLSPNKRISKRVMQVLDHCSVFFLIAGSYTPFALCTFMQYDKTLGLIIFIAIWLFAAFGITLNSIDLKRYRVISAFIYMFMGWMIIFKAYLLPELLGVLGTILLVSGGILYTIGAILYGVGIHHKWMHSVFHIFIVLGSLAQFLCIILYVM